MHRKLSLPILIPLSLLLLTCEDDNQSSVLEEVDPEQMLSSEVTINVDPNGFMPLVAEVTFTTEEHTQVTIRLEEDELVHEFSTFSNEHSIPVLGLRPGVVNNVELEISDLEDEYCYLELQITTDTIPSYLPEIDIVTAIESQMEPGWNLSSLNIGTNGVFLTTPIMFDTEGTVRWLAYFSEFDPDNFVLDLIRLNNGNWCIGSGESIVELNPLGYEVNRWDMAGYSYHHDICEKPDGNLLVAVDVVGRETVEDHIIELDRNGGGIVREWDMRDVLDVHRRAYPLATDSDWFHMNAVYYDERDSSLIISGRNQGLVKVSQDNVLIWICAPHLGWGQAGIDGNGLNTADFLLTALDGNGLPYGSAVQDGNENTSDFGWVWGQHAPLVLPSGNIFVFDNGPVRNFLQDGPAYSRGVEYEIDKQNLTIKQVWQYGEERGSHYQSVAISDVDYLPETGNRLIMPGHSTDQFNHAFMTEVSYPSSQVVFEALFTFKDQLAEGPPGFGSIDIVYRSERLSIYPPGL